MTKRGREPALAAIALAVLAIAAVPGTARGWTPPPLPAWSPQPMPVASEWWLSDQCISWSVERNALVLAPTSSACPWTSVHLENWQRLLMYDHVAPKNRELVTEPPAPTLEMPPAFSFPPGFPETAPEQPSGPNGTLLVGGGAIIGGCLVALGVYVGRRRPHADV